MRTVESKHSFMLKRKIVLFVMTVAMIQQFDLTPRESKSIS